VQNKLFALSLLVKDYDEAIQYYTEVLQFSLLENTDMGKGKRWVVVTPAMGNIVKTVSNTLCHIYCFLSS